MLSKNLRHNERVIGPNLCFCGILVWGEPEKQQNRLKLTLCKNLHIMIWDKNNGLEERLEQFTTRIYLPGCGSLQDLRRAIDNVLLIMLELTMKQWLRLPSTTVYRYDIGFKLHMSRPSSDKQRMTNRRQRSSGDCQTQNIEFRSHSH